MAYTFFPTSATEIKKTLPAPNKMQQDKVDEIIRVFNYLAANKKVMAAAPKPLVIDPAPTKYGKVKIPRALKGIIDPKKIVMDTKVKKIKIEYGDGSAGGRGVNNKGGRFEKGFALAVRDLYSNANARVNEDYKKAYNELLKITPLKNFDVGSLSVDAEAGERNTKRPIQYTGENITLYSTSSNFNIGEMLTDTTLSGTIKGRKKNIFLSLKTTSTVTFFNAGISKVLPRDEIVNKNITNQNGLSLLSLLKIDPGMFCDCYNQPEGWSGMEEKVNLSDSTHIQKLKTFLESGIGNGYVVVHQIRVGNIKVYDVDESYMKTAATPQSMTIYYGGKTKRGKRVDVVIETPKYTMGLNIRDSQGKDGYPNRIMCNFTYK